MTNDSNRHAELVSMLQELYLPTMANHCTEVALKAIKDNLSLEAFLYELARLEREGRFQRCIACYDTLPKSRSDIMVRLMSCFELASEE